MTRLPFTVTHDGCSATCALVLGARRDVKLIEFLALRDNQAAPAVDREAFADHVREAIGLLNDLLHADVPFAALASCRRSPGLVAAIIDPAATQLESLTTATEGVDAV